MSLGFIPLPLFADAGVPMIVLTLPTMAILLVPIILIEAWLCKRWLGLNLQTALKANLVSNIVSTIVGIPIAWGAMLAFEFIVFGTMTQIPGFDRAADRLNGPLSRVVVTMLSAAWLAPDERHLYWMVPLAAMTLLIPTFFLSVFIERWIVDRLIDRPDQNSSDLNTSRVRTAVRDANLVSYGLLAAGATAWLLISLARPPK